MKINNTIETPEGSMTFQGELDGKELDFVVQTGLNFLMYNNLLPITKQSKDLSLQGLDQQQ